MGGVTLLVRESVHRLALSLGLTLITAATARTAVAIGAFTIAR